MYTISAQQVIAADAQRVWSLMTDVAHWPDWDPHEQASRLDGAFAVGGTGWSKPRGGPATVWTITAVEEGRRWASVCPLPGGTLEGSTSFDVLPEGRLRCHKTITVSGPFTLLFRLYFGPRIQRDMMATFAALEQAAARSPEVSAPCAEA